MILSFRPIKVWPEGWRESRWGKSSPFSASYSSTLELLDRELFHLSASDPTLQVDASANDCRLDGQLRANAKVNYRGCILSFTTKKHGTLTYACNVFDSFSSHPGWQQNLRAIALGLESLRRVERYGIADRGQQYAGWAELPSGIALGMHQMTVEEAWVILREGANTSVVQLSLETAYRMATKNHHPDNGGDPDVFDQIVKAKEVIEAHDSP